MLYRFATGRSSAHDPHMVFARFGRRDGLDRRDSRIVKQRVVAMAVGWALSRLKAGPNGSGVNRLDTDDILAPHTPTKAPSNGSDCVLVSTGGRGFECRFPLQVFSPKS